MEIVQEVEKTLQRLIMNIHRKQRRNIASGKQEKDAVFYYFF